MASSRLTRIEENKLRRRTQLAFVAIIAIIGFLIIFGLRLVVGFSLLIDMLRGADTSQGAATSFIAPPILDPLPEATNNAWIDVTGSAPAGATVFIYINGEEIEEVTVDDSGLFEAPSIKAHGGVNTITARTKGEDDNTSEESNVVTVNVITRPPALDIESPTDGQEILGDDPHVTVKGKTEEDIDIHINERFVVVSSEGMFETDVSLEEGDNTITIVATDEAGNETTVKRTVHYAK